MIKLRDRSDLAARQVRQGEGSRARGEPDEGGAEDADASDPCLGIPACCKDAGLAVLMQVDMCAADPVGVPIPGSEHQTDDCK